MINKNINYDNKCFDIQPKKEEIIDLNGKINKIIKHIIIKLNYLFIIMGNECFIFDMKNDMNEFKKIKLDDKLLIYKVLFLDEYLFLVSNKSIVKFNWENLKKIEEHQWNNIHIGKLKQYKDFLIWRCKRLILIIDLSDFEELLNLKVNDSIDFQSYYYYLKYYSNYDITVFKNYLVYKDYSNIIKIINLDKKYILEKEFVLSIMFKNKDIFKHLYKNYLIIWNKNDKILNIIDLQNNYKNKIITDFEGSYSSLIFKKFNDLLFILSNKEKIIYNMKTIELVYNIKNNNYISKLIILRHLLINNNSYNITVLDYENEWINLNIKKCTFFKSYNNKLMCFEDKILKINDFKTDLKIISKNYKYEHEYKNYGIKIDDDIKLYDIENNNKLILENFKNDGYYLKSIVYINYLIIYFGKKIIILNLDNFNDIKEKEYQYDIYNLLNYKETLYILFKKKYIEILNIKDLNNNKVLETDPNIETIDIYENYLFVVMEKLIKVFDLNNNKIIKNIEINDINVWIKIEQYYLKINNFNNKLIYIIDIKNNFEFINIAKEDFVKILYIFNGLLIFYNNSSIHIYKEKLIIKWNYINITKISSTNNYLFIQQNNEINNIFVYKNKNLSELKILKIKFEFIYNYENLLYLAYSNVLKIYNIKNNFEEINEIIFKNSIFGIKYEDNKLIIDNFDYYIKINLNFDNNIRFIWDKISYDYFLKFENLKGELKFNLKYLKDYYNEWNNFDNTIIFNYILKINYNIIKNTETPKLLEDSLEIFGIDKFFIQLKNKYNIIDLIISSNKINIFLEPLLNYFLNNNHFYEINYMQFLSILEKIKIKDINLFKIFIKYIFQRSEIALGYRNIKYINLNEYKIIKLEKLYFDNDKVFNNKSNNEEKKEFEIYNIPFMISERISDNYKLFEILVKNPDFIKESNLKYLIYDFFDKTIYFKYFNIVMYLLLIISMTINLVNKNLALLIIYLLALIYFILYEIIQFYYDYKTYFKQPINLFDILLIIYNIVIFAYIYQGLFKSINLIIMPLYYFNGYKLINFLKSIDLIRKEIRLFINVIKNTTSFIFFIVIILIYFTNLNFWFNFNNLKKFKLSFFNVYGQMLGNFDDNFNEYKFYDFFELLVNTYSFNIILLNLFISVISKVFDNYNENLELYDIQEKINLLHEFSSVYFIIDYINKIIFKSSIKEKYYFFIFEKKTTRNRFNWN